MTLPARALSLAALAALAGCAYPRVADPPPALTAAELAPVASAFPGATEASLAEGRDLFVNSCGACHGHPDILAIDDAEWPEVMREMAPEAQLDAAQEKSVLTFVRAVRAARGGAGR